MKSPLPNVTWARVFSQVVCAVVTCWIILWSLESFWQWGTLWAAGASSLVSTAYLVYMVPKAYPIAKRIQATKE